MHILRIDYESGLRVDFGFLSIADGLSAQARLLDTKKGDFVLIADDHGHQAALRTDGILALVLTDLAAEVAGQIEIKSEIDNVKQQHGTYAEPDAPVPLHNSHAPASRNRFSA